MNIFSVKSSYYTFQQISTFQANKDLMRLRTAYYSIVELQFIVLEISRVPGICTALKSRANYTSFFNVVNSAANLVFVDGAVNNAKSKIVNPKTTRFIDTTKKAVIRQSR